MDATVVAVALLLILLPAAYIYAVTLPPVENQVPSRRRDISAASCLLALSYAAAAFVFQNHSSLRWLSVLIWAVLPAITAGTAGRRPFVCLGAVSLCAPLLAVLYGLSVSSNKMLHIVPVLGFIAVLIIVNVLGTCLLLPLLAIWENRRRHLKRLPV